MFILVAWMVVSEMSSACEPSPAKPCLLEAEATRVQSDYLAERKIDIGKMVGPRISHSCFERGCYWEFFYSGNDLVLGNHFSVVVKDPSGAVELAPGL